MEYDPETGNYYDYARYYNPRLGRFMTPDPRGGHISDPQTLNKYDYTANNPVTLTDPTGLDIWLRCGRGSDMSSCRRPHWWSLHKYLYDSSGNRVHLSGNQTADATLGRHGIGVTRDGYTYVGVWDTNKGEQNPVTVSGTGALAAFDFQVSGSCNTTCLADSLPSRPYLAVFNKSNGRPASPSAVRAALTGDSNWFPDQYDPYHNGETVFMGETLFGPSTDVTVPKPGTEGLLGFHVNAGYPFGWGMPGHILSMAHSAGNAVAHALLGVPLPN